MSTSSYCVKFSKIRMISVLAISVLLFFSCNRDITVTSVTTLSSPQNLSVQDITSTGATLTWSAVTSAKQYSVYISESSTFSSASIIGTTTYNAVNITSLSSNTQYYVWVCAISENSTSAASTSVNFSTLIGCPSYLTATKSSSSITLEWPDVYDNTGYVLYKGSTSTLESASQISISQDATCYTDTDPYDDVNYYWIATKCGSTLSTDVSFAWCRNTAIEYQFLVSDELTTSNQTTSTSYNLQEMDDNAPVTLTGQNIFYISTNPSGSSRQTSGAASRSSINLFNNDYEILVYGKNLTYGSSSSTNSRSATVASSANTTSTTTSELDFSETQAAFPQAIEVVPHEKATEFNSTSHSFTKTSSARSATTTKSRSTTTYSVGDSETFWVQDANEDFVKQTAYLKVQSTNCNVWIVGDYFDDSSTLDYDDKLTLSQLEKIAQKFEALYSTETNLFGSPYKDFSESQVSVAKANSTYFVDQGTKINILISDIDEDYSSIQTSGTLGYFWGKDLYSDSVIYAQYKYRSNECELFYIDSYFLDKYPDYVYSTLAHEFQHMLNFANKTMLQNLFSSTWYNEMLSMVCEDILNSYIGIDSAYGPQSRLHSFNQGYASMGLTQWDSNQSAYSYACTYAFGAWLTRNYGGATLVHELATNSYVDLDSICNALVTLGYFSSTDEVISSLLKEFARSLCYPELTYTEYTTYNCANYTKPIKPFCIQLEEYYNGYTYTLSSIQLCDYPYVSGGVYYYTPYYYTQNKLYQMSSYGVLVSDLGSLTGSTTVHYYTTKSPVNGYFVMQ